MKKFREKKRNLIRYIINDIRILDYKLPDDSIALNHENSSYTILFNFKKDIDLALIDVTMEYNFFFNGEIIHRIATLNEYQIIKSDFDILQNDSEIENDFLALLAELSLNHSRGLHATVTPGSIVNGLYLPIVSPEKIESIIKPVE